MQDRKKPKALIFKVLDCPARTLSLSGVEKAVLTSVVAHLNPSRNGALVWPSQAKLAELTGHGERTVRRALVAIEGLGYIKRHKSESRYNIYSVHMDIITVAINTGQSGRNADDTGQSGRYIPARAAGNTGQSGPVITNGTAKGNSPIETFGYSSSLKVSDADHQRKLAVQGIVSQVADDLRTLDAEQPTTEKQQRRANG